MKGLGSHVAVVLFFLSGIFLAGSLKATGQETITAKDAEQLVWQIPEVKTMAQTIRDSGATPFTMLDSTVVTHSGAKQFFITFAEDHGTHAVRTTTFVINSNTGAIHVYDVVTDSIIPLTEWQAGRQAVITMERTMCYGRCPVYKLVIYQNGTVEYHGERFVQETGYRSDIISENKLKHLIKDFQKANLSSMQDEYVEQGRTDMPGVILSFTDKKRTKKIIHDLGDDNAPLELLTLEHEVDTTVNSQQWIKGQTKKNDTPSSF